MENEIWKPIVGAYGEYEASSLGRIRSVGFFRTVKNRWGTFTNRKKEGRILSCKTISNSGYHYVTIRPNREDHDQFIHRLVVSAFFTIDFKEKFLVNHKNGIKTDNRIDNLEFTNYRENVLHGRNQLRKVGKKFNIDTVVEIIKMSNQGKKVCEISKHYSVHRQTISRILNGNMWPSKDYPEIKEARLNYPPNIKNKKWIDL